MSTRAFPTSPLEGPIGPPVPYEPLPHGSLRSWETWMSLGLILVAFLSVSISIEQADWVPEMPSLSSAAMLGLTAAFLLARVPWPSAVLLLLAVPLGAASTVVQTAYAMQLSDPTLGTDLLSRWTELRLRLGDWLTALVSGDVSTDPMPFILVVVLLSWLMAFSAVWSVFRLRNGWLAVIPGGIALLTNISYLPGQPSIAFVVYLFAGILIVTRMQAIRADLRWRRDRTVHPALLSLEVLNFATWAGLALIIAAWLVPTANHWGPVAEAWQDLTEPLNSRIERVGRVFFGIDAKRGDLFHKFGEVLPLQGRVRLSGEPLFTVEAPPDVQYLRAATYDEYTGRAWRQTTPHPVPLPAASIDAASFGTPQTRAVFRKPFVASIELQSSALTRRLLAPGEPLAASVDASLLVGGDPSDVLGMSPAGRLHEDGSYQTVGTLTAASAGTLARAPAVYPQWVTDRYLQLPATLPSGVVELAESLTKDVSSPYLRARRIEQHLRTQYMFDLGTPDPPPRADAVGVFLLDQRRGYFDQYASAMVVLLRASGVPARLSVGFALDPRDLDPSTRTYTISDRNAWAWPEVYLGGLGWVEFNPTPTRALIPRAQDDSEFVPTPEEAAAAVPDGEFGLLSDLEVDPTGGVPQGSVIIDTEPSLLERAASIVAMLATGLVVAGLAGLLAAIGFRLSWQYRFRGLSPARSRWAKLQELARWADVSPLSTRTPLEAGRDLRSVARLDADIELLASAYNRERYGTRVDDADRPRPVDDTADEQQRRVYVRARNQLLRLALRRLIPRGGSRRPLPSAVALRQNR